MHKLLIFDFDGTIISGSNEKYMACFDEAIKSTGTVLDPKVQKEKLLELWGKGQREMIVNAMGSESPKVDEAITFFNTCTDASNFFAGVTLVEGAREILEELKGAGCTLAIASGSRRSAINQLLDEFGLYNFFSKIISSPDDISEPEKRKPSPYMLEMLMSEFNFTKHDTYYIGDATTDMMAAKSGSVHSVAVLTGHMNLAIAKAMRPDYIIESIAKLMTVLQ